MRAGTKPTEEAISALIERLERQLKAGVTPKLKVRDDMWLCAGRTGFVTAVYKDGVALNFINAERNRGELWKWHELELVSQEGNDV